MSADSGSPPSAPNRTKMTNSPSSLEVPGQLEPQRWTVPRHCRLLWRHRNRPVRSLGIAATAYDADISAIWLAQDHLNRHPSHKTTLHSPNPAAIQAITNLRPHTGQIFAREFCTTLTQIFSQLRRTSLQTRAPRSEAMLRARPSQRGKPFSYGITGRRIRWPTSPNPQRSLPSRLGKPDGTKRLNKHKPT